MSAHVRAYRLLVALYPRSFQRDYGADLLQAFDDLVRQRGLLATWARCSIDLAVTVPRYHVEALVHRPASSLALLALTAVVGVTGVAALALGPLLAAPLLAAALILGLSQRTALAEALTRPAGERRGGLRLAASLAGTAFVAAVASWLYHVERYDTLGDTTVLLHNLVGIVSLVGAIVCTLAGRVRRTVVPPN